MIGLRLREETSSDLAAAFPGWVVARLIVLVAAAAGRYVLHRGFAPPMNVIRAHTGLMAWDANWYRRIATFGYGGVPDRGLRFFPLYPLLGKLVSYPLAGHVDWALLLLSNGLALVLGALIHRLVIFETRDAAMARRAAWLVALAPPAFVLVMGYSESLALCLAVGCFFALRRRQWWWAALFGLLAGLTRPVGVLLAVPALVEAARTFDRSRWRRDPRDPRDVSDVMSRTAAVLAPPAGAAAYLAYVGLRFGDVWLPLRAQEVPGLRGRTQLFVITIGHAVRRMVTGDLGTQSHFPWVLVVLALVVVVARRWPAAYAWYAAATVVLALSAQRLGSLERYAYGAFPLVLAGAGLLRSGRVERAVLVVLGATMGAYAAAAFVGAYVP
jgi:hypothetical protein